MMDTATSTDSFATPLQLIRTDVRVRDFQRWMGGKRLQDADHAMHCLLTECFGDLAPQTLSSDRTARRGARRVVRLRTRRGRRLA